ncbi:MAG: ABC transporter ATP-binding protein [Planctomycetaceae bacterium]|nr:ABC transporter ATP-binding protein [Planctomycetaceae bacterium]
MSMIEFRKIRQQFATGRKLIEPLIDITFSIEPGEFVTIQGPSGAGKSTLLLIAGGLLQPTSGSVVVAETEVTNCSPAQLSRFRSEKIGFVFQMFHLVPYLNVRDNIRMGQTTKDNEAVEKMMKRLGIDSRAESFPAMLSAGEQQRTALARAMIHQPSVILADEPTGNLDPENAAQVLGLLDEYRKEGGTVLVVSHGTDIRNYADRVLTLKEGKIVTT